MRFQVKHQTTYKYATNVYLQPHRLIVSPRSSPELRTIARSLTFSPTAAVDWTQDVFGNLIATASFSEPTAVLVVTNQTLVEQAAREWPVFQIAPSAHAYPFDYSLDDLIDLGALRLPLPLNDQGVATWAQKFVRSNPTDTLSLLKDLNAGILGSVTYRTRDEEGTQSASETLAKASGSCRDIAELFIEAARHLGFGARAVSGYLYDANANVEDPGSTHAWAEVYLPAAGWVAFDPTQRRVGESHLIPVAVARSNRQIMPIAGSFIGAPDAFVDMAVEVRVTSVSAPG